MSGSSMTIKKTSRNTISLVISAFNEGVAEGEQKVRGSYNHAKFDSCIKLVSVVGQTLAQVNETLKS